MTFRSLLCLCPAVCLLAQTPPPQSAPPAAPATVTPGATHVMPPGMLPHPQPAMPTVPPDRVVITVGDVKITAEQFDKIISLLPPQSQAAARGAGRKQFGDAVVRILALSEEARKQKLDQTPTFQLQSTFSQNNLLAGAMAEQVNKNLKIDDAELQKYYDEHASEFEQVHVRHILIRVKGSPSPLAAGKKDLTEEEALAKAKEIREKLVAGGDFAALAKEESYDTGNAGSGGDLGMVRHGMMVGPFEQVAFSLKVGEISEPVKTQFGYHIIKVESSEKKTFAEVKPEIERRLRPQIQQKALEDLVKQANPVMDPEFFKPPAPPANAPLGGIIGTVPPPPPPKK